MPDSLHLSALSLLVVALTVLPGCSKTPESKPAGPPAAKFGSHEIPEQLIDQLVSRANLGNASPQATQALRRELLDKLIDQQLAADRAIESKLDRAPEVVAQFEAARREVLSRAYLQSIVSATPKPTQEEMRTYYREHPPLFSERRIFSLQEIIVPTAAPDALEQVVGQASAGKSLEEIAGWLAARQIKFGRGAANRTAEQLPLEMLARIHALKDGQIMVMPTRQGFNVLRVARSEAAPLAEAIALPRIEQFLVNQRGAAAIKKHLQELRAKAGVSYLGDFARVAPEAAASAAAASVTGAPAATTGLGDGGK